MISEFGFGNSELEKNEQQDWQKSILGFGFAISDFKKELESE